MKINDWRNRGDPNKGYLTDRVISIIPGLFIRVTE
jgi:hypothetical protein